MSALHRRLQRLESGIGEPTVLVISWMTAGEITRLSSGSIAMERMAGENEQSFLARATEAPQHPAFWGD